MNIIALLAAALIAGQSTLVASGTIMAEEPTCEWHIDADVGLPAVYQEYRAEFGGCDELLYIDYTFKGEITESQLKELNPMLIYRGTDYGLTNALLLSEEPSQELLDKGGKYLQAYYDAINVLLDEYIYS